jgi:hypothetical protein
MNGLQNRDFHAVKECLKNYDETQAKLIKQFETDMELANLRILRGD